MKKNIGSKFMDENIFDGECIRKLMMRLVDVKGNMKLYCKEHCSTFEIRVIQTRAKFQLGTFRTVAASVTLTLYSWLFFFSLNNGDEKFRLQEFFEQWQR